MINNWNAVQSHCYKKTEDKHVCFCKAIQYTNVWKTPVISGRFCQRINKCWLLLWWLLLGPLSWCHVSKSNCCDTFKIQTPINKIYRFPLFKSIVVTWQGWEDTRIVAHNNCHQVTSPININFYSSILCFAGNHWWRYLCTGFVWYNCGYVMSYRLRTCGWPVW